MTIEIRGIPDCKGMNLLPLKSGLRRIKTMNHFSSPRATVQRSRGRRDRRALTSRGLPGGRATSRTVAALIDRHRDGSRIPDVRRLRFGKALAQDDGTCMKPTRQLHPLQCGSMSEATRGLPLSKQRRGDIPGLPLRERQERRGRRSIRAGLASIQSLDSLSL